MLRAPVNSVVLPKSSKGALFSDRSVAKASGLDSRGQFPRFPDSCEVANAEDFSSRAMRARRIMGQSRSSTYRRQRVPYRINDERDAD